RVAQPAAVVAVERQPAVPGVGHAEVGLRTVLRLEEIQIAYLLHGACQVAAGRNVGAGKIAPPLRLRLRRGQQSKTEEHAWHGADHGDTLQLKSLSSWPGQAFRSNAATTVPAQERFLPDVRVSMLTLSAAGPFGRAPARPGGTRRC